MRWLAPPRSESYRPNGMIRKVARFAWWPKRIIHYTDEGAAEEIMVWWEWYIVTQRWTIYADADKKDPKKTVTRQQWMDGRLSVLPAQIKRLTVNRK